MAMEDIIMLSMLRFNVSLEKLLLVVPNRKIDTRRQRKYYFLTDNAMEPATIYLSYMFEKSEYSLTIVYLKYLMEVGIGKPLCFFLQQNKYGML